MDVLSKIFNAKFIFLSFLACVILWLVYKFIEEKLSPLQKIPSPPGKWPLIGHLFTFLRGDSLELLRSWSEQYSPMFVYHPGLRTGIGEKKSFIVRRMFQFRDYLIVIKLPGSLAFSLHMVIPG